MKTVILEVQSPKEAMAGFAQAWNTNKQQTLARISFAQESENRYQAYKEGRVKGISLEQVRLRIKK